MSMLDVSDLPSLMDREQFVKFAAENGWVLFPYVSATAMPTGWQHTATTDTEACLSTPYPLGVLTGNGLMVVDVDTADRQVWADVISEYGMKPTFTVSTPSGGCHMYFKLPSTIDTLPKRIKGKGIGGVLDNVDLFAGGQHVVAPTSHREASDKKPAGDYKVLFDTPVAKAPQKLLREWLKACEAPARSASGEAVEAMPESDRDWALRRHQEFVKEAAEAADGSRDDTVYRCLCASVRFAVYMPDVLSVEQVRMDYESSCPYNIRDIDGKISRAVERAQAQPWEHRGAEQPADDDEFWSSRQALKDVKAAAAVNGDSPWAVLGMFLARVAADVPIGTRLRTGRSVDIRDTPNLFVVVPALSGGGKSSASSVARKLWPGRGSAEAQTPEVLQDMLADEEGDRSVLLDYDELSSLAKVGARAGNPLLQGLCKGWSSIFINYRSRTSKAPAVDEGSYRLCMIGGIQPAMASMFFRLDGEGAAMGLTQRMLWFDPTIGVPDDENAYDKFEDDDEPVEIKPLKPANWGQGGGRELIVEYPREAKAEMSKHKLDVKNGRVPKLDTHLAWNRAKVAFLLAVLDGRLSVNLDDWKLAGVVADHSVATRNKAEAAMLEGSAVANRARGRLEGERLAEAEEAKHAKAVQRVARWIVRKRQEFPGEDDAALYKRLAGRDREYWEEAVGYVDI